jgi:hypothetical protein
MHRRVAASAAVAASVVVLLAGCGSSSSGGSSASNESSAAPKTELTDAFHALSAGSALTTTLSLDTTSANLLKITGEGHSTPVTQQQADLISSAKLVIETVAPSGKTLSQAAAAGTNNASNVSVTGSAGGTTYLNLLVVNKTVYFKLDLKDILGLAGDSSEYQTLVARTTAMPPFVQAFVNDQYVSLPFATITALESFLRGAAGGSAVGQIPTGTQITKLIGQLETAILGDLTVARTSAGSTDLLAVTGNARDIAKDVLSTIATAIPVAASQVSPKTADQVPDQALKLDASVTGGALSKLEFDFGQFSPHQKDTLPISATFAKSGPTISAPSEVTQVDFQQLITFFGALGTATSSSSSGHGSASAPSPASSPSTSSQ